MNQTIFMVVLTAVGIGGSLLVSPFYGVAVYYLFAVLRPQFLWEWTLPDVSWSFYVAMAAMFSTLVWRLAVALAPRRQGGPLPAFNVGHFAMFGFAVWITLTYLTAYDVSVAQPFYEEYLKIFIMFFVAAFAVANVRQIWVLYLIATCMLGYIAWEINSMYFFQGGYMLVYKRGYAGLDNNGAALMLAMGVPLCLYAWDGIKHQSRWLFLACIPLLLHAVLTSYSRGAMLALLVSSPLYVLRCHHKKQLLVILAGIGLMMPILAGKEIQERFFSIEGSEQDASAQSRLTTWGIAWQMACERPIVGFGVRNSNLFTHAYGADMEGRAIHSQYLQIAADSGLVGLTAYLLVIGTFFVCLHRVRSRMKGHQSLTAHILSFFAIFLLPKDAHAPEQGRDDDEMRRAYTIANGLEGALIVFCFGGIFLSLETFELPYLLFLLGAQLWAVVSVGETVPAAYPALPAFVFVTPARANA